jgi:hypothetical protein
MPITRRSVLAGFGALFLSACGGGATTATTIPTPTGPRPTPTPPPTIDPIHVRTGSAIIPSPTGQTASIPAVAQNLPSGSIPPTVPLPTVTAGTVLQPLQGGSTFTTKSRRVSVRYPSDWDAQTADNAAQFSPKGASPTDPNVPRVTFNGLPVDLSLMDSDNAQSYVQTLAQQTGERGARDLRVRSIDKVRLGSASGPDAIRAVVSYTTAVPVVSEQVIVKQPNGDQTFFLSATAPAGDFDTKWKPIIDGIAGSITFL